MVEACLELRSGICLKVSPMKVSFTCWGRQTVGDCVKMSSEVDLKELQTPQVNLFLVLSYTGSDCPEDGFLSNNCPFPPFSQIFSSERRKREKPFKRLSCVIVLGLRRPPFGNTVNRSEQNERIQLISTTNRSPTSYF